jgi:hypothetical protein
MFCCVLCEKETVYISKFCEKCRKIKHYLNLYNERVYEILDNVLSRDIEKQNNKINVELVAEIKKKEHNLKVNKKDLGDETYIKKK